MISTAALLTLVPAVLAIPSNIKRTGPDGASVLSTIVAGTTTYYSRGCYDELKSGQHALQHEITSTLTSISATTCVVGCQLAGYSIAGVMNGNQCFCDNAMSPDAPELDAEQCDSACSGNSLEVCGGVWHYDIYYTSSTGDIPAPTPVTQVTTGGQNWVNLGCYVDQLCAATCKDEGYAVAGIEWGRECYCGNTIYNPTLAPLSECNQACSGDSTKACGDQDRILFYTVDGKQPNTASNSCGPSSSSSTASSSISTSISSSISSSYSSSSSTTMQPTTTRPTTASSSATKPCTTSSTTPKPTTTRPCTTSTTPKPTTTKPCTTSTRPTSTPTPPKPQPTCGRPNKHDGYIHQGCYNENPWWRSINQYSFSSNSMTPSMCSDKCFSKGFKYAALEKGTDCYCGNNCPTSQAPSSHCNKPCKGDSQWIGGGNSGKITVYKSVILGYPRWAWPWGWN
ncbi:SubName: Full=Related to copper radical oxidase-Phanerochaete chrysosporium {ECO:0000313/EMBL:CCA69742.1} [Serendipita indica DSM 11827]|nr:SubName: Full=Related to copper radical oxidase-Phanerochaete chrysosporium {ECO:0000313/EMBL:CCA69742.1} [Serendipita indica DSM 11827]